MVMLYATLGFAAVDVNKATAAELDSIKGIGPAISGKILDERKKGNFKDWNDFIERVKGVGDSNAAKFSSEGLTVNGSGFKGTTAAPAAPATKADAKPAAAPAPAPASAPAAPAAKEEKKDPKAEAKMKAEEAKKAKAEAAAKKADEAKAKKEAAKQAKEDAKKAKAEKKDTKADAPAAPASTPKK